MEEQNDLESLQVLHSDLIALSESRLVTVERLWSQLESRIVEFRNLLDKSQPKEQSRSKLSSGKISIFDVEYNINEQFKQDTLQVAGTLDLDELESAQLVLEATYDAEALGRSVVESAVIRFHQRRKYLLDCFRLVLEFSNDLEGDVDEEGSDQRSAFREAVNLVLEAQDNPGNGSKMVRKCLQNMTNIKTWLQAINDKVNSSAVLGQSYTTNIMESLEYQRVSLLNQHESLGLILYHLVKGTHATVDDFEYFLGIIKRIDKYDNLLVNYFPSVGVFIGIMGSPEGSSLRDARRLNDLITGVSQEPWSLSYVQAAVVVWWLGEYSGRHGELPPSSPLSNVDVEEESRTRTRQFTEALKDGAFDFLLSLSADVKSVDWLDPARHGLRQWLQRKAPPLSPESSPFSSAFQDALMEQLEQFIDAFITNMPDVLRRLRTDEDEQRQLSQTHEHDLDLERFLVIISYAFDGRSDAALSLFWTDAESNLAGFLQWASRRASTPLMSAFCEMLQALSEGNECATAAHEFLLDEGSSASGKIRRNHSLTWSQIFKELKFFTDKIQDRPVLAQSAINRLGKMDDGLAETEPESAMMLESYLRLISRLCTESFSARDFLFRHPTFHILDVVYQLAGSAIPSRLRACAFTTLRSLTSHKTHETSDSIWLSLDSWISGGYSPGTTLARGTAPISASRAMIGIFHEIGAGFEEPNAFIQLLTALVAPCEGDSGLNDSLPFPEALGSANRMPGIDPYVDFAMGDVFSGRNSDTTDQTQLRLIRLTCLDFMRTCLSTFNEDLVIFANHSSVTVDSAMRTSDLSAYICLHPFARVMEWMYNDKVMAMLFGILHQDSAEVAKAAPDSPFIFCLLQTMEVVGLVIELQSTYFNIVRPAIKLHPTPRGSIVANAAYSSFEEGILNHLAVFTDLGLYVGAGHSALTLASLKLLQKLTTSQKLSSPGRMHDARYQSRDRAISSLDSDNEADRVSRSLLNELTCPVDIAGGSESDAFMIKSQILDLLIACLELESGRPTMAHLLLGFECRINSVDIKPDSSFNDRQSVFHAIVDFVSDGVVTDNLLGIANALMTLRCKALHILRLLWRSSMTSQIVLSELRNVDFVACLVAKEPMVDTGISWDGRVLADLHFMSTSSAECLTKFFSSRSYMLQYLAAELRAISKDPSSTPQQIVLSTLLGNTMAEDGQQVQHSSIFDFFDFMEFHFPSPEAPPEVLLLQGLDLSMCLEPAKHAATIYNLNWVQELLMLHKSDLLSRGGLVTSLEDTSYDLEAQQLVAYLAGENNRTRLNTARSKLLESWVQTTLVMTQSEELGGTSKTEFILRTLQIVMPKLEAHATQNADEAAQLFSLTKMLIFSLDLSAETFQLGDIGEAASDRLFELFCLCLRAIHSPLATAALKETLYCICYRYLTAINDILKSSKIIPRHSIHTIKVNGERLLDVICDDAYAGEQTCRVAAILLLGSFIDLAAKEKSKYLLESLVRLNALSLMVDSIKDIPEELREMTQDELPVQFAYYNAKLSLLLRISQTRLGAAAVLNAGLLHNVRASRLFSMDPDLGIDVAGKKSVEDHYVLLLAIMRVMNAAILSRGQQNEQIMVQGRRFLSENRLSILTAFKRSANLSSSRGRMPAEDTVEELVEAYLIAISTTLFLDFEDDTEPLKSSLLFT